MNHALSRWAIALVVTCAGCSTPSAGRWEATRDFLLREGGSGAAWEAWAREATPEALGFIGFKGGTRLLDDHTALHRRPGGTFAVELGRHEVPESRSTIELLNPGDVLVQTETKTWAIGRGGAAEARGAPRVERVYIKSVQGLLVVDPERRTYLEIRDAE